MKTALSNPVKLILMVTALMLVGELINAQTTANTNLALNKTAAASSREGTGYAAAKAFDGDRNTRFQVASLTMSLLVLTSAL